MSIYEKLPLVTPDELHMPAVGEWGREKYIRAWNYNRLFSTGMKNCTGTGSISICMPGQGR